MVEIRAFFESSEIEFECTFSWFCQLYAKYFPFPGILMAFILIFFWEIDLFS